MAIGTFCFVEQLASLKFNDIVKSHSSGAVHFMVQACSLVQVHKWEVLNKMKCISSFENAPSIYFWTWVLVPSPLLGIALPRLNFLRESYSFLFIIC